MALAADQTEWPENGIVMRSERGLRREAAHPTDVWIGNRIRTLREARGLSQAGLAEQIGIAYQQIQKYETGENRVCGSRLADIAKALKCSIAELFPPDNSVSVPERDVTRYADNYESLRLVRAFATIANQTARASLLAMAELLSRCGPPIDNQ